MARFFRRKKFCRFTAEGVSFDGVLGLRTYPWAEVGALYIEALGGKPAARGARGVPVAVDFAGPDGGRVRGDLVALERDALRIVLGGDTEVALPYFAIDEIVVDDGRLRFVSDLVPREETRSGQSIDQVVEPRGGGSPQHAVRARALCRAVRGGRRAGTARRGSRTDRRSAPAHHRGR